MIWKQKQSEQIDTNFHRVYVCLSLFLSENVCGRGTQQIFDGAIQVASPMASPHNYNKFKKKKKKKKVESLSERWAK